MLSDLLPANGGDGFVLQGIDPLDSAGISVDGLGDINGDGIADLVVGAFDAATDGRFRAGEVYTLYGHAEGFPATFQVER